MIIVELMGGLGNQLFQYATARSLAAQNNTKVKINPVRFLHSVYSDSITDQAKQIPDNFFYNLIKKFYTVNRPNVYKEDPKRVYRLNYFNINGSLMNFFDFTWMYIRLAFFKVLRKFGLSRIKGFNVIHAETEMRYLPEVMNLNANTYLIGFWQTEKYFQNISEIIKKELEVKIEPTPENAKILEMVRDSNAVSLHVRRGDYVKQDVKDTLGTCDLAYYTKAIEYIKANVKDPHFFIFSDEPDWARENIKTGCPTTVPANPVDLEYEDLRLMYNCKHFIIANSSFSWWGAWLSRNKSKLVIAPRRWFTDKTIDDSDIVPQEWVKM